MNFVLNSKIPTLGAVRARAEPTPGETTHPGPLQASTLHVSIAETLARTSAAKLTADSAQRNGKVYGCRLAFLLETYQID